MPWSKRVVYLRDTLSPASSAARRPCHGSVAHLIRLG
jgi:hypothetical protein